MRRFDSFLVGLTALLVAGPAAATVVIDHVATSPVLLPDFGGTFSVQVRLKWDGQGALQGVRTSTTFDPSVIELVSYTTAPASILDFLDDSDPENPEIIPGLSRLTNVIWLPDDASLGTVQYGGFFPVDPRAATTGDGRLITTLTFRAIGPGQTDISALLANDGPGVVGDTFQAGASVRIYVVPEPGTALLLVIGLAGLGFIRR
jgi:PEP-CTERM motif